MVSTVGRLILVPGQEFRDGRLLLVLPLGLLLLSLR